MILTGLALASSLLIQTPTEDSATESVRIQPCTSWRYNTDVNAYVCSFYSRENVPTMWDFDRLERDVQDLERKVSDLEKRVKDLENDRP